MRQTYTNICVYVWYRVVISWSNYQLRIGFMMRVDENIIVCKCISGPRENIDLRLSVLYSYVEQNLLCFSHIVARTHILNVTDLISFSLTHSNCFPSNLSVSVPTTILHIAHIHVYVVFSLWHTTTLKDEAPNSHHIVDTLVLRDTFVWDKMFSPSNVIWKWERNPKKIRIERKFHLNIFIISVARANWEYRFCGPNAIFYNRSILFRPRIVKRILYY